jgi:hypothetical protein
VDDDLLYQRAGMFKRFRVIAVRQRGLQSGQVVCVSLSNAGVQCRRGSRGCVIVGLATKLVALGLEVRELGQNRRTDPAIADCVDQVGDFAVKG